MFETPILDREARIEWESEGRQVAQEDFETTMSELTEMYFEDECASCMEDILVEYLLKKDYLVIFPWMRNLKEFDYIKVKEEMERRSRK